MELTFITVKGTDMPMCASKMQEALTRFWANDNGETRQVEMTAAVTYERPMPIG